MRWLFTLWPFSQLPLARLTPCCQSLHDADVTPWGCCRASGAVRSLLPGFPVWELFWSHYIWHCTFFNFAVNVTDWYHTNLQDCCLHWRVRNALCSGTHAPDKICKRWKKWSNIHILLEPRVGGEAQWNRDLHRDIGWAAAKPRAEFLLCYYHSPEETLIDTISWWFFVPQPLYASQVAFTVETPEGLKNWEHRCKEHWFILGGKKKRRIIG